jgi:hypothetical protein
VDSLYISGFFFEHVFVVLISILLHLVVILDDTVLQRILDVDHCFILDERVVLDDLSKIIEKLLIGWSCLGSNLL